MRIEDELELEEGLRVLARSMEGLEAPPGVERSLLAAFERRHKARRLVWELAGIAAVLMLALGLSLRAPQPPAPRTPERLVVHSARGDLEFVSLAGSAPWGEYEQGHVIRVRLPRPALMTLGFPLNAARTEAVQADVIVGEDGMARGIRLVR